MCNDIFNQRLAPLNQSHLLEVQECFPKQAKFAKDVFDVLTRNLTPQANLLVAFVVLKDLFDCGRTGIFGAFGRILYVPLSIVAQTGPHEWTRFRPPAVGELHTSFLSFMMAKENRLEIESLFGEYGLTLSQRHCCGIVLGDAADVASFESSELAAIRNKMRSYAEAMGMPVASVEFDAIPAANSDLGTVEREFYTKYEAAFAAMTPQERAVHIEHSMTAIWEKIVLPESHKMLPLSAAA